MATFFGILQQGLVYNNVKSEISNENIRIIKYYPTFHLIKFEADTIPQNPEFLKYFESIEEEKNDFSI